MPGGALKIIDRKKNLFKLAHGEYVAVEKLENQFKKTNLVDQIWVHGDSEKSSLVAVVHPSKSKLEAWAQEQGKSGTFEVRHTRTACAPP
jgi:long-chain acyl-CoA synthetase